MSQTDFPLTPDLATGSYDAMLEQSDKALDEITDKIDNGRIRNPKHEKIQIQYHRALWYLIRTRRKVLGDRELQEFREVLESHDDIEI